MYFFCSNLLKLYIDFVLGAFLILPLCKKRGGKKGGEGIFFFLFVMRANISENSYSYSRLLKV